jgi:hypothetical protein
MWILLNSETPFFREPHVHLSGFHAIIWHYLLPCWGYNRQHILIRLRIPEHPDIYIQALLVEYRHLRL